MTGKTILHYEIIEELGRGGMGVVYLAQDLKLKREVAIKFLPRIIGADSDERKRFEIEAQAAAALNHPNIAHIYAIEESDDQMFIVMEYIEGKELKDLVGAYCDAPIPINNVINYATQMAKGLDAAHKKGIVHRDIKSANIMITGDDHLKIMDFGLAKVRGGTLVTKSGTTFGTAAYMSPEQVRGNEVDHRSDIWSFGVVLYEMLTGKLPFSGDYEAAVAYSILNEEPSPISGSNPEIPATITKIIEKLLKKNSSERYQNTAEILSDLADINIGQSSLSPNAQQPLNDSRKSLIIAKKNILFLSTIALVHKVFSGNRYRIMGLVVIEPVFRHIEAWIIDVMPAVPISFGLN